MSRAVKEAGAVGDFVAANKVPIATGATAMALAALLSKRNRLAKALGWGAVGAGLGKAGQLYLDAYKRPEGSVPDYLKRQPVKAQESGFNPTIPGVSPRIQTAIAAAKLPQKQPKKVSQSTVPPFDPEPPALWQKGWNEKLRAKQQADRGAFEKALSATDGAGLTAQPSNDLIPLGFNYDPKNHGGKEYGQGQPVAGVAFRERGDNREPIPSKVPSMPLTSTDYLRAPQPGSPFVAETPGWVAGATPAGIAGIVARARQRRAEQQASRAEQMSRMQQRLPGTEMLKDTARETVRNLTAPAASYVDKVTGRARDTAEALGKSAEGKKNIKRLEAERKAQLKRQQEELGHVPLTPSQKLDNFLRRLLSK